MDATINTQSSENAKIPAVDTIRGLAILMVVISHNLTFFTGFIFLNPKIEVIWDCMRYGVQLFYLASAFTLCLSWENSKPERKIQKFFLRRFFRIGPAFYVTLTVFGLFNVLVMNHPAPSAGNVISNILFCHQVNPFWINSAFPGAWSISIEVLFYLMFPVLIRYINTLPKAIIGFVAAAILGTFWLKISGRLPHSADSKTWDFFVYFSMPFQLAPFMAGFVLYFLFKRIKQAMPLSHPEKTALGQVAILLGLAFLIHIFLGGPGILSSIALIGLGLATFAIGLLLNPTKWLVNPLFVFFGKISYSLYLWHYMAFYLYEKLGLPVEITGNQYLDIVFRFVVTFGISVLISLASYHWLEVPSQNLGKRIINGLGRK
jgi:peptidoglycan/LPS O-acetylase OafA/YrhL